MGLIICKLAQNIPSFVLFPPYWSAAAVLFLLYKITAIMSNEAQIKSRIDNWAKAINQRDWGGVLAWHHENFVMYDLVPPLQSDGIEAYRETFVLFFENLQSGDDSFVVVDPHIVAGEDAAFFFSPMKCVYYDKKEQRIIHLDFRLTIGFRKIDGEWWFVHEHHSEPAQ